MDIVWLLTAGISGVLIYICYMDIRWRRIPNRATLLILLLSCLAGFTHMPYPAFILPGILLALGFIAVMVKLMGAGILSWCARWRWRCQYRRPVIFCC